MATKKWDWVVKLPKVITFTENHKKLLNNIKNIGYETVINYPDYFSELFAFCISKRMTLKQTVENISDAMEDMNPCFTNQDFLSLIQKNILKIPMDELSDYFQKHSFNIQFETLYKNGILEATIILVNQHYPRR